jgi:Domain of unknown function (DUF4410)
MKIRTVALAAVIYAAVFGPSAAGKSPAPYSAVEVDPFVADRGVAFPVDYQKALVEDIAREISVVFKTAIILREGDAVPFGHAVLRISGTVVRYKTGNGAKKSLLGFGAGGTTVQAQVRFADASTGQVLLIREVKGGIDSQGAGDSIARKIAKLCDANHFVESHVGL